MLTPETTKPSIPITPGVAVVTVFVTVPVTLFMMPVMSPSIADSSAWERVVRKNFRVKPKTSPYTDNILKNRNLLGVRYKFMTKSFCGEL